MKGNKNNPIFGLLAGLFLISSACQISTNSNLSMATSSANTQFTEPTMVHDTPQDSYPADTNQIIINQYTTIDRDNLEKIVSSKTITLPDLISQIIWPSPDVSIPGLVEKPDMIFLNGSTLYPVQVDPPEIGHPILLPVHEKQLIAFAPDATSLVVQSASQFEVISLDGKTQFQIDIPANPYGAMYSSDGNFLAVTSLDTWEVALYDTKNRFRITSLNGFETAAPIYSVIPGPGGQNVAWYSRASLMLQDIASGNVIAEHHFIDFITSIEFSPDGNDIILIEGRQLHVIDSRSGVETGMVALDEYSRNLHVSPDNDLVVISALNNLQFYTLSDLQLIFGLHMDRNPNQAMFSPDNQYIVVLTENHDLFFFQVP